MSESDILILLIGKAWASYKDETGRRRLELPRDPVRLEVETALRLGIPIIPVRVEGAPMPTEGDLIPSILDLLEFNAAEVSDSRWEYDVDRLLRAINETVERSLRPSGPKAAGDSIPPVASPKTLEERQPQNQAAPITQPDAGREVSIPRDADNSSSIGDALDRRTSGHHTAPNQHLAPGPAARGPITRARRDAEEQGRRNEDEAERQVHPRPEVGQGPTLAAESSPLEAAEEVRTRSWGAARILLRQRAVILATTVGIGGVVVLVAYLMSARPVEATIMGHLPNDLRASCTATADKSATCHLTDGTVVFFHLFDTVAEADANVVNGNEMAPDGDPCPPSAPSAETSVVCRYAVGAEKGVAMFSYTAKAPHRFYLSRWIADAEPLLRGEMSTTNANPQDWTTLQANWTRLAGMG